MAEKPTESVQIGHIEYRLVRIADYKPHPENYRIHPREAVLKAAKSLKEFGQAKSVTVWRDFFLAGHKMRQAAEALGWTHMVAGICPDDWSEERALGFLVADNEHQKNSQDDQGKLLAILQRVKAQGDDGILEGANYNNAKLQDLLRQARAEVDSSGFGDDDDETDEFASGEQFQDGRTIMIPISIQQFNDEQFRAELEQLCAAYDLVYRVKSG